MASEGHNRCGSCPLLRADHEYLTCRCLKRKVRHRFLLIFHRPRRILSADVKPYLDRWPDSDTKSRRTKAVAIKYFGIHIFLLVNLLYVFRSYTIAFDSNPIRLKISERASLRSLPLRLMLAKHVSGGGLGQFINKTDGLGVLKCANCANSLRSRTRL